MNHQIDICFALRNCNITSDLVEIPGSLNLNLEHSESMVSLSISLIRFGDYFSLDPNSPTVMVPMVPELSLPHKRMV